MTDTRLRPFWHRAGPLCAAAAVAAGAATQGCGGSSGGGSGGSSSSSSSTTTSSSTSTSTSTSTSSSSGGACAPGSFQGNIAPGANGGFSDPFDATPSSDGSAVFFTALDMSRNPGVFKQGLCPAGGTASPLYTSDPVSGGPFVAPFGIAISTDDGTLFIADPGAVEDPTDPTKDRGVLFKLSAAGGTAPSHLVDSVSPRSVTVARVGGSDTVFFTGIDKANGLPGVFKVAAAGGAVTIVAEGPPFNDPGGLTVTAGGDIYVLDTSGSATQLGNIIVVSGGTATEFVPNLQVGYPAGIALMHDDSTLLASGMDPTAYSNVLFEVTVSSKAVNNNTMGVGAYNEAAGLHRALKADVFAWADTKATPSGMTGTGTVFVIK